MDKWPIPRPNSGVDSSSKTPGGKVGRSGNETRIGENSLMWLYEESYDCQEVILGFVPRSAQQDLGLLPGCSK